MPRLLRDWVTFGSIACLAIAVAAVAGTIFVGWGYEIPIANRSDLDTTVIGLASLVLVLVGAVLALWAFRAATGRPDLYCEIKFNFSKVNEPVFEVEQSLPDPRLTLKQSAQTIGTVRVFNRSRFSAQNPGVRLVVKGLYGLPAQSGWTTTMGDSADILEIQWDGTIIHGKWSRILPDLQLVVFKPPHSFKEVRPEVVVTVAADGIEPKEWRLPIRLLLTEDYREYLHSQGDPVQASPDAIGG